MHNDNEKSNSMTKVGVENTKFQHNSAENRINVINEDIVAIFLHIESVIHQEGLSRWEN